MLLTVNITEWQVTASHESSFRSRNCRRCRGRHCCWDTTER